MLTAKLDQLTHADLRKGFARERREINTASLPAGMYLIKVEMNNKVLINRFVKR
jgi:hypothetical protein